MSLRGLQITSDQGICLAGKMKNPANFVVIYHPKITGSPVLILSYVKVWLRI